jgi:hypothetical protein
MKYYQMAIDMNPTYMPTLANLGCTILQNCRCNCSGQLSRAQGLFEQTLLQDPSHKEAKATVQLLKRKQMWTCKFRCLFAEDSISIGEVSSCCSSNTTEALNVTCDIACVTDSSDAFKDDRYFHGLSDRRRPKPLLRLQMRIVRSV